MGSAHCNWLQRNEVEHHGKRQIVGTFAELRGGEGKRKREAKEELGRSEDGKREEKGRGKEKRRESGGAEWIPRKDLLVLSKCP